MTLNDLLLYSYISALLIQHQRSFFLQQMGTNVDTHHQYYPESERPWNIQPLKGWLHQILRLRAQGFRAQGFLQNRKQKECKNQRGWKTTRKQDLLNQYDQSTYELTEAEAAHTACTFRHQIFFMYMYGFHVCANE